MSLPWSMHCNCLLTALSLTQYIQNECYILGMRVPQYTHYQCLALAMIIQTTLSKPSMVGYRYESSTCT